MGPGGANAEGIPIRVNTESLDCNETGYQHITFYHPSFFGLCSHPSHLTLHPISRP
jgi:hypothetical protein